MLMGRLQNFHILVFFGHFAEYLVEIGGLVLSLEQHRIYFPTEKPFSHPFVRSVRNEDGSMVVLVDSFQSRSRIHTVSDYRVIGVLLVPDISHDGRSGIDSYPGPNPGQSCFGHGMGERIEIPSHPERSSRRENGVLGIVERSSPKGHYGVSYVFVDGSLLLDDAKVEGVEYPVQRAYERLGFQCLGNARKPLYIAKQYGYVTLFGLD